MKASSCCSPTVGSWYNSTHSRMRSSLAKHIVQRLSSKRVRQIEIRFPDVVSHDGTLQKYRNLNRVTRLDVIEQVIDLLNYNQQKKHSCKMLIDLFMIVLIISIGIALMIYFGFLSLPRSPRRYYPVMTSYRHYQPDTVSQPPHPPRRYNPVVTSHCHHQPADTVSQPPHSSRRYNPVMTSHCHHQPDTVSQPPHSSRRYNPIMTSHRQYQHNPSFPDVVSHDGTLSFDGKKYRSLNQAARLDVMEQVIDSLGKQGRELNKVL